MATYSFPAFRSAWHRLTSLSRFDVVFWALGIGALVGYWYIFHYEFSFMEEPSYDTVNVMLVYYYLPALLGGLLGGIFVLLFSVLRVQGIAFSKAFILLNLVSWLSFLSPLIGMELGPLTSTCGIILALRLHGTHRLRWLLIAFLGLYLTLGLYLFSVLLFSLTEGIY